VASRPPPSLKQFYQQTHHKTGKTARNFSPPPPPPPFLLLLHLSTAAVWSMLLRIHVKSIWIILASPQTSIQQPLLWRSSSRRKSRTLLFLKILKILFLFQPKHAQQENLWMGVQVFLSSVQIWCIWELASTFPFQHRVFAIPMVERTHAFQGGKQFSCHSSPQVGRVQFLLLW
jgi:hypothetical protein